MPDRPIIDLTEATELTDADLAVIYQGGETKQITAETMKEYMGGGIGDISALPAASTIASNDLAVISQGGTAKKVTAQQLKTFIEGDTPGETVTLTLDETGTQYTIPFTVVDPTGTEASDWTAYLLTSTPLTEAEIQTMRLYEDGTEQVVSDTLTFSEWQNGGGTPDALYYVANGTKSLIVAGGSITASNRRALTVVFVIPEAGANYPAGTYVNKLMNDWHTYTYTVGGSSSGGEDIIILDANNDFVLSEADKAMLKTHVEDGQFKVFVKTLNNEIREVPLTKLYEEYFGTKYLTATGVVCPPQTYDFLASVDIEISNSSYPVTACAYIIPIDNESTITIVRTANYAPSIKGYFFPYLLRNRYVWDTGNISSNNFKIFDRSINQNTGLPDMTSHYEYTISSMNEQKTRIVMTRTQVQN